MRGDVLFWTSDGSWASRLIALATAGPYVHVSVDLGDGTDIGAHAEDGTQCHPLISDRGVYRWRPPQTATIEPGIAFLRSEVGNKYGWSNIFNNLLKLLRLPYRVTRLDRYDCSSLVTRYLDWCGIHLGALSEEPDSVSPNDLARALHLIP